MLQVKLRLGLTVAVAVLFVAMAWEATEFQALARYFPQTVTVAGGVFAVMSVFVDAGKLFFRRSSSNQNGPDAMAIDVETAVDDDSFNRDFWRAAYYAAWFIGYGVLISLVGILSASAVFLALFLKIEAGARWRFVLVCTLSMLVLLYLSASILSLHWPTPLFAG